LIVFFELELLTNIPMFWSRTIGLVIPVIWILVLLRQKLFRKKR
jgi:hypothetical protein